MLRLRGILKCGWGSTMRKRSGLAAPQIMILFLDCGLEECSLLLDSVPRSSRSTDLIGRICRGYPVAFAVRPMTRVTDPRSSSGEPTVTARSRSRSSMRRSVSPRACHRAFYNAITQERTTP